MSKAYPKPCGNAEGQFEPATTASVLEKECLNEDLENFRLFAMAKLDLAKLTASQYICKIRPFLEGKTVVTDKDVRAYIKMKKIGKHE